jgi:anti-sigma factor RsiW
MTCREFVEFLWRYTSDELSPEERTIFDTHLSTCRHCVKYLDSYRETIRIGKAALAPSTETTPTEVPEDLIKAILASRLKVA